jgi:hypothetical protein
MKKFIECYTSAPECYDGFGTETIQHDVYKSNHGDKKLRLVKIDEDHKTWQEYRYASGNHLYSEKNEFESNEDLNGYLYSKI